MSMHALIPRVNPIQVSGGRSRRFLISVYNYESELLAVSIDCCFGSEFPVAIISFGGYY